MRSTRWLAGLYGGLFGLLGGCGLAMAGSRGPVAMVTDLQGKVTSVADSATPALSILSELDAGTRLRLEDGAHATAVYLDSGQEYEMTGPAEVLFASNQPQSIKGAAPLKHGVALKRSHEDIRIDPVHVTQSAIVMRSFDPDQKIKLLDLSDTATLDARPVFQWHAPHAGLHYQVALLDDTGKPLFNATTDDTSVQLTDNVQLQSGMAYTWVVSGKDAAERSYSNAGDFSLASAALRTHVENLRPAADAPLSERVVFATWLEQMHLRDEARKLWKAIAAERQDDARLKVLAGE